MSAIFDIDGTLVIKGVQPNKAVIDECNNTPDAYIITGRPESDRATTVQLLNRMGVKYARLMMNPGPSDEANQILSKVRNAKKVMAKGEVTLAVDDNAAMRQAYSRIGIKNVVGP